MKRFFAAILMIALVLTLCACGEEDPVATKSKKKKASKATTQQTVIQEDPQETAGSEETTEPPVLTAKYTVLTLYDGEYQMDCAELFLYSDMTFQGTVNLYAGYGKMEGTWTWIDAEGNRGEGVPVAGNIAQINCTITSKSYSGFDGDQLAEFSLVRREENLYQIEMGAIRHLGAIENGHPFTVQGDGYESFYS